MSEFGEIAGAVADVELVLEDVVPAILASAGRSRQHEEVGALGDAGGGAGLERRCADFLKADHPKHLAEARDFLLDHSGQRFRRERDVPPGNPGAAGADHHFDCGIINPCPKLPGDRIGIILHDLPASQLMPCRR